MFFALFVFLTLVFLGLVVAGVALRNPLSPALIMLGAVFCILVGASLFSEGIEDEWSPISFEKIDNQVFPYSVNALTVGTDNTVLMLAYLYMYGGFGLLFTSLAFLAFGFKDYWGERRGQH